MGECYYYLKAECGSTKKAKEIKEELEILLKNLIELRETLVQEQIIKVLEMKSWVLLNGFELNFEDWEGGKDRGIYPFVFRLPDIDENFKLEQKGTIIKLSSLAGHFTHWDGIVKWLQDKGCKAGYTTEEMMYKNLFENINLE